MKAIRTKWKKLQIRKNRYKIANRSYLPKSFDWEIVSRDRRPMLKKGSALSRRFVGYFHHLHSFSVAHSFSISHAGEWELVRSALITTKRSFNLYPRVAQIAFDACSFRCFVVVFFSFIISVSSLHFRFLPCWSTLFSPERIYLSLVFCLKNQMIIIINMFVFYHFFRFAFWLIRDLHTVYLYRSESGRRRRWQYTYLFKQKRLGF